MVIGPDGDAEGALALEVGAVGADRVECGRRTECRVVVVSDRVGIQARPVTLGFRDSAGASYDTARLIIGLLTAAGLMGAAAWLVRSTDWTPPPEADTTAIDEAEFADLDLEADQFDEARSSGVAVGAEPGSPPG